MRKIIAYAIMLVFIATSSLSLAATKKGSQEIGWVSGKVIAIENGILSLREPNGQIFKVAAASEKLKGIHVGEGVVVKDVNGWVASIKSSGKKAARISFKRPAA